MKAKHLREVSKSTKESPNYQLLIIMRSLYKSALTGHYGYTIPIPEEINDKTWDILHQMGYHVERESGFISWNV